MTSSIISLNKPQYTRKRILVFDVETTGLFPPKSVINPPLSAYPHILQLSFVVFDTQFWRVVKSCDFYIRVAESIEITPFITELTGITRKLCDERGIMIEDALYEFYQEYMQCDCVVAHNLDFDRKMVCTEFARLVASQDLAVLKRFPYINLVFDPIFVELHRIEEFCTMCVGRGICKIQSQNSRGTYIKNPKLSELYLHLFGQVPTDLHNSLMDTYVCLRCFVKLRFKFDLRLSAMPISLSHEYGESLTS